MKAGKRWACLCGTVLIASHLQDTEPHEILVALTDSEGKPVDLDGFAATLTVSDQKGWKKAFVMPVARPSSPAETPARGELRKVPGTSYRAELHLLKPVPPDTPRPAGSSPPVFDHPLRPADPSVDGRKVGASPMPVPGPCFRAPIAKRDLPKEGELVVHLILPDDRKCSVRWALPLWAQETPIGDGWREPWDAMAGVDREVRAEKRDEARAAVERVVKSLRNALKDAEFDAKKSEDCLAAALELQRHVEEGKDEPALASLKVCRARFRELAPFEERLEREN